MTPSALGIPKKNIFMWATREGLSEERSFAGCLETFLIYRYFPPLWNLNWLVEISGEKPQICCPCQNRLWPRGAVDQTPGHWSYGSQEQPGHELLQWQCTMKSTMAPQHCGEGEGAGLPLFQRGLCRNCQFGAVECTDPRLRCSAGNYLV